MGKYGLLVKMRFAAAHNLRGYDGNCERLHGHNWLIEVALSADKLGNCGMCIDFREVKKHLAQILDGFDHNYLNKLEEFKDMNPTTENIARLVYNRLAGMVPDHVRVRKVTAWESEDCGASYGED